MREIKHRKPKLIPMADKKMVEKHTGFSQSTLRNWRTRSKHSEIFVKFGGKVFIDSRVWDKLIRKAGRDSRKKAKEMQKKIG